MQRLFANNNRNLASRLAPLHLQRQQQRRALHCKPGHRFDPDKIIPHEYGHVRVISNTTRDAQQSNCSAEMAHEHRMEITKLIDDCYKDMEGFPGYEQVWGGTIPMFDIWKRGVNPFDSLRQQSAYMPNTPSSMLFRSTAITSMANLPYDVIDSFTKLAVEAGNNIFTNFDAHNDWRNHVKVAESVQRYGGHYQAALSWAVYPANPTIYNVQWAVDFFRECVKLGAHSLYIKDPSGVLTPEMAGALCGQIKEAFPDKPLCLHTHYQTGFGYMTYLEAVKNGANGVECSLGFSDGAGQPYSLTMLRAFEDYGFKTGRPNKAAMTKIMEISKKMRPLYASASTVRTPDVNVEDTGIAGGQRTILDKELIDANQPHLIPLVDIEVQKVRAEGGKVCQVTPVADTYAREAVRRLRGGSADSGFIPGFSGILVGEGGRVMDPVNPVKQKTVFRERIAAKLKALNALQGAQDKKDADALTEAVIAQMGALAKPTILSQRLGEVTGRIKQLNKIKGNKTLLDSLNRKIVMAQERGLNTLKDMDEEIGNLQREEATLNGELAQVKAGDIGQTNYEAVLKGSSTKYGDLLKANSTAAALVQAGKLTASTYQALCQVGGFITCAASDLIPDGMPTARKELEAIEAEHVLGTHESANLKEELAVLQACFGKAAIPNLYLNFLKNYRENMAYWPALYTGHTRNAMPALKAKPANSALHVHHVAKELIGDEKIGELVALSQLIAHFNRRIAAQEKMGKVFAAEVKADEHAFKRQLAPETVERMKNRVVELESQLLALQKKATEALKPYTTAPAVAGARVHFPEKNVMAIVSDIVAQSSEM